MLEVCSVPGHEEPYADAAAGQASGVQQLTVHVVRHSLRRKLQLSF